VWLDPRNAAVIVGEAATRLARLDPARAALYRANAAAARTRLEALDAELVKRLAPLRGRPYVVLHDAYQYLERRYDLSAVGAVTVSPDRMPGARRIAELRARVRELEARCLFGEPQVRSALLAAVAEGGAVTLGVLDPLGVGFEPGPDAYFRMMEANASALAECLLR
jgi:zinc transport system substrate-binding protein